MTDFNTNRPPPKLYSGACSKGIFVRTILSHQLIGRGGQPVCAIKLCTLTLTLQKMYQMLFPLGLCR